MLIKDIGGEFELIKKLTANHLNKTLLKDYKVIKSVGDDCAVIDKGNGNALLVTTDMIVEEDHFSLRWQTPYQVGKKLMEVNVSDIVSMAGIPKLAFISIALKHDTTVEFMEELYQGLNDSAKIHNVIIIGGDTTHGKDYCLNLTLIGECKIDDVRYRKGAKLNDLICVTGKLGASTAGLNLLRRESGLNNKKIDINQFNNVLLKHKEPISRLVNEGTIIGKFVNAMIDVSDGLSSEVKHICNESDVGAEIKKELIPIDQETIKAAEILDMDVYDFALSGGEDFEIVFTIQEKNIEQLRKEFDDFTIVGKILDKSQGTLLIDGNEKILLGKGYNHFN